VPASGDSEDDCEEADGPINILNNDKGITDLVLSNFKELIKKKFNESVFASI
jgi:hypothetical protein